MVAFQIVSWKKNLIGFLFVLGIFFSVLFLVFVFSSSISHVNVCRLHQDYTDVKLAHGSLVGLFVAEFSKHVVSCRLMSSSIRISSMFFLHYPLILGSARSWRLFLASGYTQSFCAFRFETDVVRVLQLVA